MPNLIYTLQIEDANTVVRINQTGNTIVNIPENIFDIGTQIILFREGTGELTISYYGTILSAENKLKLRIQNSCATLIKLDSTTWILAGDIA